MLRCYYACGSPDHIVWHYRRRNTELLGQSQGPSQNQRTGARGVKSKLNSFDFLHPDSDNESSNINTVRIQDKGSKPREVVMEVQGVSAKGVTDSGADITIMGVELFKQVASVACLKSSAFRKPNRIPYTYNNQPFSLDGKLELGISFDNRTMRTGIINYHPQCDGMVERFNCTLTSILRKHTAHFGSQWDRYLPGVMWAYQNTPHDSTGEKHSFLLLGHDCRTPTEACYLPETPAQVGSVEKYREELMHWLTSARDLKAECIQKAQGQYRWKYDQHTTHTSIGYSF